MSALLSILADSCLCCRLLSSSDPFPAEEKKEEKKEESEESDEDMGFGLFD